MAQANRQISVTSPLGDDVLLLRRMTATDGLSRLFEIDLDLLSENRAIRFADVLGLTMTVRLTLPQCDEPRYFNGYVSRFRYAGTHGRYAAYQATLRPWFWLLTRTADCRIFQGKTVPEIIEGVFRDRGFTDFVARLSGNYRQWEYCVQYRETDFQFLSRLMEQEGIYFHFRHTADKHELVLSDSQCAHHPVAGYEEIPYFPPDRQARRDRDHIFDWTVDHQIQPGAYALNDFDFTVPRKDLRVASAVSRDHAQADFEIYDYPGEFEQHGHGEDYARIRIEELQAQHEVAQGRGDARGLSVGALFRLTGFPRDDQNREYLTVSATHQLQSNEYESDRFGEESAVIYECTFSAMDSGQPFRPPRLTARPMINGPQTAIVVGPKGEEIWTDQYGRVKCQFHWDRYGNADENSSCWIRVSQQWAGQRWGSVCLPRIGQEVIVDFLEGDPDRPIVTGRVFNADQMPPYGLPANRTQSGIKSRSSKGGGPANFNEIRFEDATGQEQVYVHAERNLDTVVEANETRDVGANRTTHVHGNFSETVNGNETRTVDGSVTETVNAGETRTINAGATETVNAGEKRTVNGGQTETVNGGVTQTVIGGITQTVTGAFSQTVTDGVKITTPGAVEVVATGGIKMIAPAGYTVVAPGGQTQVDDFWTQVGGAQNTVFQSRLAMTIALMEVTDFKLVFLGMLLQHTSFKFDFSTIGVSVAGVNIKNYSAEVKKGIFKMDLASLHAVT